MSILHAIVLGIVQGLTEFLPVSSSGHLVMFEKIFNIQDNLIFLNVILHLGTLLAVVIYYRKRLWGYFKKPFQKEVGYLALATIPAVLAVLALKSLIEDSFGGDYLVIGFMLTATLLVITNLVITKKRKEKPFTYKSALVMGVAQGLAIFPGISRSGSTICGGTLYGNQKEEVANFAFLMSIPIILASLVYECFSITAESLTIGALPITVGFVFAFVFGLISIHVMLKVVKKANFYWFAVYLVMLSITLLIFNF